MGHRILLTGRPLALQGIEYSLPTNLARVDIALMNEYLQDIWLRQKWKLQVGGQETETFRQFIRDHRCPQEIKELACEPLLLYLLATLHRAKKLSQNMFEGKTGIGVKIRVYQESIDWVLRRQRPTDLTTKLTGLNPFELRRILSEAALCVTQIGKEQVSIKQLKQHLSQSESTVKILAKAEEYLGIDAHDNILVSFYLKTGESKAGSIEFVHKSFREFLTAESLYRNLEYWTQTQKDRFGEIEYKVRDSQLYYEIFGLLGYGGLTLELLQYLMSFLAGKSKSRLA